MQVSVRRGSSSSSRGPEVAVHRGGEKAAKSSGAPSRARGAPAMPSRGASPCPGPAPRGREKKGFGNAGGLRPQASAAEGPTADTTGKTDTGKGTGAKGSKMSNLFGFLSVPFWSPPSPAMPKPKKRRPQSGGRFYTLPSESLVQSAPRSVSVGAPHRGDRAGPGGDRKCHRPSRTSKKAQASDESFSDLGSSFEAQGDEQGERQCYRPPQTSKKAQQFDESIFELGFTFEPQGDEQSQATTSRKAPMLDEGLFDLDFDLHGSGSMRNVATSFLRAPTSDDSMLDANFQCIWEERAEPDRGVAGVARRVAV